jgi:hypothetical protein
MTAGTLAHEDEQDHSDNDGTLVALKEPHGRITIAWRRRPNGALRYHVVGGYDSAKEAATGATRRLGAQHREALAKALAQPEAMPADFHHHVVQARHAS